MTGKENKQKFGGGKPFGKIWKKWWFWVIVVVMVGGALTSNKTDTEPQEDVAEIETVKLAEADNTDTEPTQTEGSETKEESTKETQLETEQDETEQTETGITEPREGMYGISNKNIDDTEAHFSVSKARNDVTGNWRISTIAETIQIEEYALSYYEKYFSDDKEVHVIVNFTNNTSTAITCLGSMLVVSVHEYVDKEEHDAKMMCSGMLLNEYHIYLDNGDIEKIQ